MIVYDVKLICPVTQEVIYQKIDKKAVLPPEELYKRIPKPVLVIDMKDASALKAA